jgi:polysaccharide pyruvyl transferase WcaK-like protein
MVNLILRLATSVTVRSTASAAGVMRLSGRECRVTPDPAFDYLAARTSLDLISPPERARIEEFLSRSPGTLLVCVNARPTISRRRQGAFAIAHERMAAGLVEFAERHPVRYVFVPLEAEANTGADLRAGSEIGRHISSNVDFRVWHELPGIDAILGLFRASDAAVTMRLHAAIFALSQNVPTVGIDSRVGVRGKMSELFDDRGAGERVIRLAELDPRRLASLLSTVTEVGAGHVKNEGS